MPLESLFWFLAALLALAFLQRLLHRALQGLFLTLSRSPEFTLALFSILFLPGVLLHELSHYLMAVALGVQTARFSLVPQALPDGRLQLGYVETSRTDVLRDALIGAAPLFMGGALVAYLAITRLHLLPLWEVLRHGQFNLFWIGLTLLPQVKDFPLWFYLIFTISSTMLPSASDRHAWLPLGLAMVAVMALAVLAGAGRWMLLHLAPWLDTFLHSAALIFGLSAALHVVLLPPAALLHALAVRLRGSIER